MPRSLRYAYLLRLLQDAGWGGRMDVPGGSVPLEGLAKQGQELARGANPVSLRKDPEFIPVGLSDGTATSLPADADHRRVATAELLDSLGSRGGLGSDEDGTEPPQPQPQGRYYHHQHHPEGVRSPRSGAGAGAGPSSERAASSLVRGRYPLHIHHASGGAEEAAAGLEASAGGPWEGTQPFKGRGGGGNSPRSRISSPRGSRSPTGGGGASGRGGGGAGGADGRALSGGSAALRRTRRGREDEHELLQ